MSFRIKKIIEEITPPVLINIYKEKFGKYGFFGNYSSWEEATKTSEGYDSEIILNKVKDALLKVKSGEASYERDSVLFDKIEYSWPLLTALLWIALKNGNKMNLVDFGGSLGSSYFQNRFFLTHLNELKWNIVEQSNFVDCGKQYFENDHLKFYYNLNDCKKEHNSDIILFLSVIQYLEKPYALLEEIITYGFKYIVFDRTPFLEYGKDRITVQQVPPKIYKASYPAWFFNRDKFLNFFIRRGYEVVAEFDTSDKSNIASSGFKGFIFKRATHNVQ